MRRVVSLLVLLAAPLALAGPAQGEEVRPTPGFPAPAVATDAVEVHRFEGMCNAYIVTCRASGDFVVVDPHPGIPTQVSAHVRAGHHLVGIWITHEHGDHLAGIAGVPSGSAGAPVPLVAHAETKQAMSGRARGPGSTRLPDRIVAHGDSVALGKTRWTVLHLPGHSRGSVGFLLPGAVLVAGDVLFRGSVGRTDLPTSDLAVFQASLATHLWELPDAVAVLPGHGETSTIAAEKRENWLFQDYVRAARGEPPIARPWFGIQLDPDHRGGGLRLADVTTGSPAASAGLRVGDVLLVIDGVTLGSTQDLFGVIRRHGPGETVSLTFRRGTEARTVPFQFGARPPQ